MKTPVKRVITQLILTVAALAGAVARPLGKAPFAGAVSKIEFIPNATVTGVTADARTITIINKGQSGIGTTVLATLAFTTGVNATAFVPKTLTLSVVTGALDVAAGDIIAISSNDTGTNGTVDPGGQWIVEITRSNA